jgi:parallel beta-helix repeat protein
MVFTGGVFIGYSTEFNANLNSLSKDNPIFPSSSQSYVVHAPILIGSDGGFGSYNFTGVGTRSDPYLIEGYNITAFGALSFAIDISNTNAFFVINNCVIYSDYVGVGLDNVGSGTSKIIGNTIISLTGDGGGIVLGNMQNCTISDNNATNFMQGIHLNYVDGCIISNNYFYDINYQGINIRFSGSNLIIYNRIRNARQHGIALVGASSNNIIHHNILDGNTWAESYSIDNEPKGIPSSQGYDEGEDNIWYDSENQQGNAWSDYFGIGPYQIDGPSNSVDLYPSNITGLTPFNLILLIGSIAIILVGAFLYYKYYHKKKRM